jgi:hypothetical protein
VGVAVFVGVGEGVDVTVRVGVGLEVELGLGIGWMTDAMAGSELTGSPVTAFELSEEFCEPQELSKVAAKSA